MLFCIGQYGRNYIISLLFSPSVLKLRWCQVRVAVRALDRSLRKSICSFVAIDTDMGGDMLELDLDALVLVLFEHAVNKPPKVCVFEVSALPGPDIHLPFRNPVVYSVDTKFAVAEDRNTSVQRWPTQCFPERENCGRQLRAV